MVLKVSSNRNYFQNEKIALEYLRGQNHTITLEELFSLHEYNCYGLLFRKYSTEVFISKTEIELYSYMYQLLQIECKDCKCNIKGIRVLL
jgi:hypothetical protein